MKNIFIIISLIFLIFSNSQANEKQFLPDGFYKFLWTYKDKGRSEYLIADTVKFYKGKLEHLYIPCHKGIKGKYRKNFKYKLSKNGKKFSISGTVNLWEDLNNAKIDIKFDKDKIENFDITKKSIKSSSLYGDYEKEEVQLKIIKVDKFKGNKFICNGEIVKFNSFSPKTAKEMLGGLKKLKKQKVYGDLYIPQTNKQKIPLIITLHPSMGFVPEHHFEYFNNLGIAILDIQTFKSRGIEKQWHYEVSEEAATIDAYAALDKISKDPRIDKNKIAVMGFSYGAMAVINTHQKFFIDIIKPKNRFMAHISYYPLCYLHKSIKTTEAPLYIFIGEKDRLTPYEFCEDYAKKIIENNGNVVLEVFPEATHRFDWKVLKSPITMKSFSEHKKEFILSKLDSSYPRYDIGEGVFDTTEPNGWSYFSLKDENYRKNYYSECCNIKSTLKYNDNAATKSLNIIKNIFSVK
jgi:dienelactone hydrolase